MGAFDQPVSGHIGSQPVLWVGSEVVGDVIQAIVVNAAGGVTTVPVGKFSADWRHIKDRSAVRPGVSGPGWVDLSEIEEAKDAPATVDEAKATVMEALGATPSTNGDFLTDSFGNKYTQDGDPIEE